MNIERLDKKRRSFVRVERKLTIDKRMAIERLGCTNSAIDEARIKIAKLQESERQLAIQLSLLSATRQLEMYELYTSERVRISNLVYEAEEQLVQLIEKYNSQLEQAAGFSHRERVINEESRKLYVKRRLLLDEASLDNFQIHKANSHV